jgi:hypothetical protein
VRFRLGSQLEGFVPLTKTDETAEARRPLSAQYKSLLKAFAIRVCVAVTLGVIALGAVELYSYQRYLHTGGDVLEPAVKLDLAERGNASDRAYWKEYEESNKVLYHQYVLWRRAPYQGESISINQDGVRRTLHTHCDEKTFTIWMFGDSVMWGAGAPDAETIPSLVARDYEKAGKPVCIVNYAEKGWSNTQEMVGLIEQLKHITPKPDIVLFYDGGTEAFAAYQSGQADVHSNFNLFKNFLDSWGETHNASFSYWRQTNTYRLLEKIALKLPFDRNRDSTKTQRDNQALSSAVIQNYAQNIQIVSLLGKQYGFHPIFVWYPNLAAGHKELTPYEQKVRLIQDQEFPDLTSMYEAVYSKSGEIKSKDFYNLEDLVDDQKSSIYVGISHMRPEGDRIVADALFNLLQSNSQPSGGNLAVARPEVPNMHRR